MGNTPRFPAESHRYHILDGLRGVAAMMVILYHFGEGFASSAIDQWINHGYLAVDFFFVLSGFVLGYAYDSRWKSKGGNITPGGFMLRRVIRLHPMVIAGILLGVISFVIQGCVKWDGSPSSYLSIAMCAFLGLFCIPCLPGAYAEIRGNGEMFPLNGPSWSLFFEYIGSILYAIWLHRLSTKALKAYVVLSALGLAAWTLCDMSGTFSVGSGWTLAEYGFIGGFLRLSFSFSAGLLMSRVIFNRRIPGAFWIAAIIICVLLSVPYVTSVPDEKSIFNGCYDLVCTLVVFPAVIWLGACGVTTDALSTRVCSFLGAISYPIYMVHYPAMYLYYWWVWSNGISFNEALPVMAIILVGSVIVAYLFLRFYDLPVRRYLTRRLVK